MQIHVDLIQKAMGVDSFWLHPESNAAKIVNFAVENGYVRRLSHTQVEWVSGEAIEKLRNEDIKIQTFDYMMLSRLQSDCKYYLGWGKFGGHLWAGTVEAHITEMKRLWNVLIFKPEWLTMEQIEQYEYKMLNKIADEL